jgi:hypothetical protein
MQTARIVQAVILMIIVALAASCAVSKEYTSKLFAPRTPVLADSTQSLSLRFLELDKLEPNTESMVSTDIIMGRDTTISIVSLDNLAKNVPAKSDTTSKNETSKPVTVMISEKKIIPVESEPVAKSSKPGEVRTKRTRD